MNICFNIFNKKNVFVCEIIIVVNYDLTICLNKNENLNDTACCFKNDK